MTKYVGGEQPPLDKMGGGDWQKRKGRARKAVREIAAELIRLYAARMSAPGHKFGPDTPWQRELEDAFAYVETPDQLAAIPHPTRTQESEAQAGGVGERAPWRFHHADQHRPGAGATRRGCRRGHPQPRRLDARRRASRLRYGLGKEISDECGMRNDE